MTDAKGENFFSEKEKWRLGDLQPRLMGFSSNSVPFFSLCNKEVFLLTMEFIGSVVLALKPTCVVSRGGCRIWSLGGRVEFRF